MDWVVRRTRLRSLKAERRATLCYLVSLHNRLRRVAFCGYLRTGTCRVTEATRDLSKISGQNLSINHKLAAPSDKRNTNYGNQAFVGSAEAEKGEAALL